MRLKYFSLGVLITVTIYVIVNIFIVINRDEVIVVKTLSDYDMRISSINGKIEKIKDIECKEKFTAMAHNIDKTYFRENTTVNEYYHNYFEEETFLNLYGEVMESCNIPDDDSLYVVALAAYTFPSSIKSKYNLKHEFRTNDLFTRNENLKEEYEVGTYSTKVLELKVIEELIGRVK